MARRSVLSFLCLLYFANNCMDYSLCTFYNNYYEEYGLESEKLCHILGKVSTIDIKVGAAIVRPKYMLDRWNVRANVHCKFKFITAKGYGLFGVIQKMSFRKNGTQCLDYVQFKRKDFHKTEKFCGLVDRSNMKYAIHESEDRTESQSLSEIYAEYDPSNHKSNAELETEIFISKEKLEEGEFLAIRIAYTTFGNCSNVGYKRYKLIGHDTCLLNEYFCDGVYNCIPGICSDEDNCNNEITSSGTGTNVTIGAVSSLILCFIIFIVCLWICKRSQKLCWSIDCADSNVCSRPEPLSRDTEGSVNPSVPSAPMLEVAVPSSVADKDLPPSYDSLFPEQSNPARS
ncbi:uncharacterized protein LOC117242909 isoform X1 [Bombus vosnesenskii]|uniref:Uncharacterized protein LOC117242909 isoform X1 n=1 Tax=Bombus vosnesenskii TaxID=207650 RepID=A0A6J3LMA7_9HYME|nr:uncharacterized protein LOC117242909 isoform X1 [Bombus vosnesenskii]XP_050488922.1 uncharacterized protein LOC126872784 [Bombus huntii]